MECFKPVKHFILVAMDNYTTIGIVSVHHNWKSSFHVRHLVEEKQAPHSAKLRVHLMVSHGRGTETSRASPSRPSPSRRVQQPQWFRSYSPYVPVWETLCEHFTSDLRRQPQMRDRWRMLLTFQRAIMDIGTEITDLDRQAGNGINSNGNSGLA